MCSSEAMRDTTEGNPRRQRKRLKSIATTSTNNRNANHRHPHRSMPATNDCSTHSTTEYESEATP